MMQPWQIEQLEQLRREQRQVESEQPQIRIPLTEPPVETPEIPQEDDESQRGVLIIPM